MKDSNPSATQTRQRLLEAAGEVFAEQGFHGATVREICERAKANVAAVNYHFGDKEGLYGAVLQYAHTCSMQKYPPLLEVADDAPPEERLRAFIESLLLRIFDEGRPAWHGKLMAREFVEPTRALDALVEQAIRPLFERLQTIVRDLLGQGADPERLRQCAESIVGQCLYYHHARAVIARMSPQPPHGPGSVGRLAGHITRFSLAALKGLASGEAGVPT